MTVSSMDDPVSDVFRSKDTECPVRAFQPQPDDRYGGFFCGAGLENLYPKRTMFGSDYIWSILLRMGEEPRGLWFERRFFISLLHNSERLASLRYLFDHGFVEMMETGGGKYLFRLTDTGYDLSRLCHDSLYLIRAEQLGVAS